MTTPEFHLEILSDEFTRFHKVIEAAPADKLDYKPDPKARTARELIGHLIGHTQDLIELLDDKVIHHRNVVEFDALSDGLEMFDQSYRELETKLAGIDGEAWGQSGDFYAGASLPPWITSRKPSWRRVAMATRTRLAAASRLAR